MRDIQINPFQVVDFDTAQRDKAFGHRLTLPVGYGNNAPTCYDNRVRTSKLAVNYSADTRAERMRTISGNGLTIVPIHRSHAREMFELLSADAIYEFIDAGPPSSVEQLAEKYARLESGLSPDGSVQWLNWVVSVPGRGLVGLVQASVYPDRGAEVAFVFGSAFWGCGYAQAAMEAMLGELASEYGVRSVFATADQSNSRSLRLLDKLGFVLSDPNCYPYGKVLSNDVLAVRQ
jgi:[ribosomal protein S5]-alanine N-acetyltransferase